MIGIYRRIRLCFSSVKAFSCASPHTQNVFFFRRVKKGLALSAFASVKEKLKVPRRAQRKGTSVATGSLAITWTCCVFGVLLSDLSSRCKYLTKVCTSCAFSLLALNLVSQIKANNSRVISKTCSSVSQWIRMSAM